MFAKFKIEKSVITALNKWYYRNNGSSLLPIDFEKNRLKLRPLLKELVIGNTDVIDGSALQKYVFPTGDDGDYDVFLSHSHNDLEEAKIFASWLTNQCGLKVFLDSYVWGSADGLLNEIDQKYCKNLDGLYNYHRRNYSTAHVHAMLSMAIMDIINKTECCIFIESNHSIKLQDLKNSNKAKTLSPWIYEEISMMRYLPTRKSGRRQICFSNKGKVIDMNESFDIGHSIDLSGFNNLDLNTLINFQKNGVFISEY